MDTMDVTPFMVLSPEPRGGPQNLSFGPRLPLLLGVPGDGVVTDSFDLI